ncbi:MAG: ketopantoate reductase family protein [Solirubrobacteraceae bacterium]
MRFVVYGVGAVGGAVAARLHQGGHEVVGIARGAHLDAIRSRGLTLITPAEHTTVSLPVVDHPRELRWRGEEVVLLATKSQDTSAALHHLREAAGPSVPVVCVQNGVENERAALRLFGRVYGATVMLPAAHLEPGVVLSYGARLTGMVDLGRYPGSVDDLCEQLCDTLRGCRFEARALADVMRAKHAKLLLNLGNAPAALCPAGEDRD